MFDFKGLVLCAIREARDIDFLQKLKWFKVLKLVGEFFEIDVKDL